MQKMFKIDLSFFFDERDMTHASGSKTLSVDFKK